MTDARCPVCGSDDPEDRFSMLDQARAFDAGISGCPDPFHDQPALDDARFTREPERKIELSLNRFEIEEEQDG